MSKLGVVIGRFQVPELHTGHRELLEYAKGKYGAGNVLVIIGDTPGLRGQHDPLTGELRKAMLREIGIHNVVVHMDHPSDAVWAQETDQIISVFREGRTVELVGGRDSCLPTYSANGGLWPVVVCQQFVGTSGTAARSDVRPVFNEDFRRGMTYAQNIRPDLSYQTVDVLVWRLSPDQRTEKDLLFGRKAIDGSMLRLIGGFVDPKDSSLETAARREVTEEAGNIEIGNVQYVGSYRVNDYRYRQSNDKILTALFTAQFIFGYAKAGDDLDAIKWIDNHKRPDLMELIHPVHRHLVEAALDYV